MKKIYLLVAVAMTAMSTQAQEPTGDTYMAAQIATEDLNGTARYVGMGGAMEALGADISTISSNPAGIGLFRKSQISGSFGLNVQQNGKSFADGSKTNASFDQIGFVYSSRMGQQNFVNFGFNYHKSRNFDYVLSAANALKGSAQCNQTTLKAINDPDLYSYDKRSNRYDFYSLAATQLDVLYVSNMVDDPEEEKVYSYDGDDYTFDRAHTGYIGEYDFNLSGNVNNRLYWGLTVGVNSVHYKGYSDYHENLDGYTDEVTITDSHKITGYGYSVKGGIIFRPMAESSFRIGAYISTPTFYKLETSNYTTIDRNHDNESFTGKFRFNTPWKFGLSLGHTIGTSVALGATYEYSDYATCDMRTIDGYRYDYWTDTDYEESSTDPVMKRHTESSLKSVHMLKLGAELKVDKNVSLRAGYNYVSPIYQKSAMRDQSIKSPGVCYASTTDYTNWDATNRFTLGAGFTFDKFRLDLAYQYQMRDGDFYPFMKNYSADYYDENDKIQTVTNSCEAVKVKDNRHQFLCTLSYTF